MTLDELFRRVIRSHVVLITLLTLLPVGLVLAVARATPPQWDASLRIQATATVPNSSTEAEGLSSRVLAIATTPNVVNEAMRSAGLRGDPVTVSENQVTAQRLGESPIVELSVTETTEARARSLVDSLSVGVLSFMNNADRQRFDDANRDVSRKLADARSQQDRLARRILVTAPGPGQDRLSQQMNQAQQTAAELSAQASSLTLADLARGRAVIIDPGHATVVQVSTSLGPRLGLALLLGLCLGLAAAAAVETLRPRIPDARGLARALDTPVLSSSRQGTDVMAQTLSLAARRHGHPTLVLLPANPDVPREQPIVSALVRSLTQRPAESEPLELPLLNGNHATRRLGPERLPRETVFADLLTLRPEDEPGSGMVIVYVSPVTQRSLEDLRDMLRATRWPLLGVLDATTRGRRHAAEPIPEPSRGPAASHLQPQRSGGEGR